MFKQEQRGLELLRTARCRTSVVRSAVLVRLTMTEYEAVMAAIYSTCVVPDTLDESPIAYKRMVEIVEPIPM